MNDARINLQRNAELRNKDSKFVSIQPGEKIVLLFDPEKIEPMEREFDGKKSSKISIYSKGYKYRSRKNLDSK